MRVNKLRVNKYSGRIKPYVYIFPALLFMGIFVFIPILLSVYMSFFSMQSLGSEWEFVGMRNFVTVFKDGSFTQAILRTIGFGAFSTVTSLAFGMLLAVMLHKSKYLGFFRYIFYLPAVVSAVTMGRIWQLMLIPSDTGLMNKFLMAAFGVDSPVNWLGDPNITYLVVLGIGLVGAGGGMTFILFTTALNNIPEELIEAARVEGAGVWKLSFRIKFPLIMPTISAWLVLSIIGSLKSFEFIYSLTGGGPLQTTTTIGILLFESGKLNNSYGASSAMGLLLTIIVSVFTFGYMALSGMNKDNGVEL